VGVGAGKEQDRTLGEREMELTPFSLSRNEKENGETKGGQKTTMGGEI